MSTGTIGMTGRMFILMIVLLRERGTGVTDTEVMDTGGSMLEPDLALRTERACEALRKRGDWDRAYAIAIAWTQRLTRKE